MIRTSRSPVCPLELGLPGFDFWLFDSRLLVKFHFDAAADTLGVELTEEPAAIVQACQARDTAWRYAVPLGEFTMPALSTRQVAEAALRLWNPAFTHGDLQIAHVFVDGGEVTGIIDWSEAGQGDALYDLATFTLGHEEHLDDVIAGYGTDVDLDVIHAWWSLRSLLAVRWLIEYGFDPFAPGCGVDVLRSRM